MGITTVLIFLVGLIVGGLATAVYLQHRVQAYTTECANIMLQNQADAIAQIVEAEERGRWKVMQTIDTMFTVATSTCETERAQIIPQPDLAPPQELLFAYGVSRVEDLPDPLRAVWDKTYTGGDK